MKKLHLLLAAVALLSTSRVMAMTPTWTGYLINDPALAYSTAPAADLNALQVDELSFQAVYSSASLSNVNFNNGTASTGSVTVAVNSGFTQLIATDNITIGSTASLAATKATDNITIVTTTGLSGQILTVNGRLIHAGSDFAVTTTTGAAEGIKTLLNTFPGIVAARAGSVVYATATAAGLAGNSFTMNSSTPAAMTVASAHFIGGAEQALTNAVLTIDGKDYRNGYLWKSGSTSAEAATSIAALISTLPGLRAQAVSTVVYATATTAGAVGNSHTIVSSTAAMVVGGASFTNGRDSATVTINGVVLTYGTDWSAGASTAATAKVISDAIMANTSLNAIVSSTWTAGALVNITALTAGPNYSLGASPSSSLSITGGHMTGGAASAVDTTNDTITATAHGLTKAYAVLFSTISGATAPSGLTNQTTYYAIPVDANTLKLASSSTLAQAGTAIDITSQGSTSGSFRFAPLGITGSSSFKWQQSNDGTNWTDISVSSVTFGSPYTAASTFWDFGQTNMHYIRANFVAPTTGGINIQLKANGKRNP